jgi:hypothetical protein
MGIACYQDGVINDFGSSCSRIRGRRSRVRSLAGSHFALLTTTDRMTDLAQVVGYKAKDIPVGPEPQVAISYTERNLVLGVLEQERSSDIRSRDWCQSG